MKILFVIPTVGTGGAERVVSILANYLSKENEVRIFVMEKSTVERYPINKNVSIVGANATVRRGNKFKAVISFAANFMLQRRSLIDEIKNYQPNVAISFLPKADFLTSIVLRKSKICWIPSERNDPSRRNLLERKVLCKIYKNSNVLVCQTEKVSKYYKQNGVMNTCIIKNPLILSSISDPNFKINYKYIISVGRLDKQKNYEMLIRAFAQSKEKDNFKEKLVILGDGPEYSNLKKLISDMAMEDYIYLLGRKTNVTNYLSHASAFCMSSDYEGLPNAMLEAMASNLPIISTDFFTGAARELVDKSNGYIVPVGNTKKMSEAISRMLSKSEKQLIEMGKCSKDKVSILDVETISKEWEKIIEQSMTR